MHAGTAQALHALVADDHYLVREGLARALRRLDDRAVVVEAATIADAVQAYRAGASFDIVLLDLGMPGMKGLEALDEFQRRCPDARIVVVSATYDFETVRKAVGRGVLGFIPKLCVRDTLEAALRFVLDGGIYVPPEAISMAEPRGTSPPQAKPAEAQPSTHPTPRDLGLTARQIEVLRELLQGKSNKQICREMGLAASTVKGHVRAIFSALRVSSRTEAILVAARMGWTRSGGR